MRSSVFSSPTWNSERDALGLPLGGGAHLGGVERHDQAFISAPAVSHAEQRQSVEHCRHGLARLRLEDHREEAGSAEVIALPKCMPGMIGQGRVKYAVDLGALAQPLGNAEGVLHVPVETNGKGAQPPQRQIHVVGARELPHLLVCVLELRPGVLRAGDETEHGVGVPGHVFGRGLDRDITAFGERLEVVSAAPRVIDRHQPAVPVHGFDDRRHILDFHRVRAGRFKKGEPRVGLQQLADPRSDERVVIGGFNA